MGKILKNSKNKSKIINKIYKDMLEIGDRKQYIGDIPLKFKKDKEIINKINYYIVLAQNEMKKLFRRIGDD